MNFAQLMTRVGFPILGVLLVAMAYQTYGWAGVAAAVGALVMWALLQFTRMMQVLRRAKDRPIGYVDSAVMLNAKLQKGQTLLHVMALTRSIGLLQSDKGAQPEVFRWTDTSQSHVTVTLADGKVTQWQMVRPEPAPDAPDAAQPTPKIPDGVPEPAQETAPARPT